MKSENSINEQIIQLFGENATYKEISEKTGLTINAIKCRICTMRKSGKIQPVDRTDYTAQIIELYNQKFTKEEIAKKLGLRPEVVLSRIKKLKEKGLLPKSKVNKIEDYYEKIIAWYNEDLPYSEMAERIGCSERQLEVHIYKMRKKGLLPQLSRKEIEFKSQNETIMELYYQGLSGVEIGERVGLTKSAVEDRIKVLRKNGKMMPPSKTKPRTIIQNEKLIQMYNDGYQDDEIAEALNITKSAVRTRTYYLRKEGVLLSRNQLKYVRKREDILKYYKEGLTATQISRKIKCSLKKTYEYLQEMQEEGLIQDVPQERKVIKKQNEIIMNLYYRGLTIKEIAQEMNFSKSTVEHRISNMKKNGIMSPISKVSIEIQMRNERILEMFNQGYSTNYIGKEVGLSEKTIREKISNFRKQGILPEERQMDDEAEKIAELIAKGYSRKDIEEEMGLSSGQISHRLSLLKRKGKNFTYYKNRIKEQKIIEMYNSGYSYEQIGESLGVTALTIKVKVGKLKKRGLLQERSEQKKEMSEQNKKIIELYNKSYSREKIAEITGLTQGAIGYRIEVLKREGVILSQDQLRENKIIEMYKRGYSYEQIGEIVGVTLGTVKTRINCAKKQGRLQENSIEQKPITEIQFQPAQTINGVKGEECETRKKEPMQQPSKNVWTRRRVIYKAKDQNDEEVKKELLLIHQDVKKGKYDEQSTKILMSLYIQNKMYSECITLLKAYSKQHKFSRNKKEQIDNVIDVLERLKKKETQKKDQDEFEH